VTGPWRSSLIALGATLVLIITLFHRDAYAMARIWWDVSTYNHCLFIPPIIGWLIWQRKDELKALTPRAWWPGLIGVAAAGLLWMLGEAGGIALFRHASLVLMLQSATVTLLGPTILRGILFPLFYLIFLIPLGDEAVPMLQTITAKMCMILLSLFGVPAQIDGVFITTPTGLFEVAEACSGVKFLVAMVAYSTLVANVCFKAWRRRILFLIMAALVPVIANGIRAFATIYISYLEGDVKFAASFDHIIFGWVFFAVVMLIVMGIGWHWFDRSIDEPWINDVQPDGGASPSPWLRAGAVIGLLIGTMGLEGSLAAMGRQPLTHRIDLPKISGWARAPQVQAHPWNVRFVGADHLIWGQFANAKGERVDLAIILYGWQQEGREIVGYGQGAVDPASRWSWVSATKAPVGGKADKIMAPGTEREVASFYWIGGTLTGSGTKVKFETLKSRLTGTDQASAAVFVSAEDSKAVPARPVIDAFLRDLGPVDQLAQQMIKTARGQK
jgi:exosortase A